jgi:hypothetical protein
MTGFLSSVKADLLDRRVLPILALLGVALVAALAYAVLGGDGSTAARPTPATSPAPGATGASGIVVSQAQANSNQAVAETTNGSSQAGGGSARNPFTPLTGATSTTSTTNAAASSTATSGSSTTTTSGSSTTTSSGSTTTSKSVSGSSSPSSGGASPTTTPKSSSPAKPQTVYHVAVLFGVAPAGTPPPSAKLATYENPRRETALPSSRQPLVVFRGVTAGGRSATFTLVREAILRGGAVCLPSRSRCKAIDLKPGKSEELEYLTPGGAPITYQLHVVAITSSKASTAAARRAFRSQSKAGREVLRRAGLVVLPGLRYSSVKGVLVFVRHRAFAGRARAWRSRREKH